MDTNTVTSAQLFDQAQEAFRAAHELRTQAFEAEARERAAARSTIVSDIAAYLGADPEKLAAFLPVISDAAFIDMDRLVDHLIEAKRRMSAGE